MPTTAKLSLLLRADIPLVLTAVLVSAALMGIRFGFAMM
jgi:hypothetical protein